MTAAGALASSACSFGVIASSTGNISAACSPISRHNGFDPARSPLASIAVSPLIVTAVARATSVSSFSVSVIRQVYCRLGQHGPDEPASVAIAEGDGSENAFPALSFL